MTSRPLTPRMRQLPPKKSAVLSVLDVGASKVVSLIARLTPTPPSEALPDRTHRCRVLGIGHQRSRGVKAGAIVDLDAAESAIRLAVDAAERMSGVEVDSVVVNMSGGRLSSQLFDAKIALRGIRLQKMLIAARGSNRRPQASGDHAPHGAGLAQARLGDLQIQVGFHRFLDQLVQGRVIELPPPLREVGWLRGGYGWLARSRLGHSDPLRGGGRLRRLIIRADHATTA